MVRRRRLKSRPSLSAVTGRLTRLAMIATERRGRPSLLFGDRALSPLSSVSFSRHPYQESASGFTSCQTSFDDPLSPGAPSLSLLAPRSFPPSCRRSSRAALGLSFICKCNRTVHSAVDIATDTGDGQPQPQQQSRRQSGCGGGEGN